MTTPWWTIDRHSDLAQGDLLRDCPYPRFSNITTDGGPGFVHDLDIFTTQLIVVTQSCDLANSKADYVALCQATAIEEFEAANIDYMKRGRWEEVRKGRVESLHLLASPHEPDNNRRCIVVDFGNIVSLPLELIQRHGEMLGNRPRLNSPYLEHLSQSFARFFMRVGLPSTIPRFS